MVKFHVVLRWVSHACANATSLDSLETVDATMSHAKVRRCSENAFSWSRLPFVLCQHFARREPQRET